MAADRGLGDQLLTGFRAREIDSRRKDSKLLGEERSDEKQE